MRAAGEGNSQDVSRAIHPSLVPAPANVTSLAGVVTLTDGVRIETPPELAGVARWFRRLLEQSTGWSVEMAGPSDRSAEAAGRELSPAVTRLVLELGPAREAGAARGRASAAPGLRTAAEESYRLRVAEGTVTVSGGGAAGVFYGLQTLRQLLPDSWWRAAPLEAAVAANLAGLEIGDAPAFAWRGVHLDVARHFMPKGFVLKLIDLIALHKCNVLHLHLTDDQGWRLPVAAYPRLVEVGAWRRESPLGHYRETGGDGRPHGGYYTAEDMSEIVAYAAERFVDVLPEIDMPGHMQAAIAAYPELGNSLERREVRTRWGISRHVLNLEPATLRFCTDVLDEVMDLFPWRYVHVGGDECPTTEWEASEKAQGLMRQEGFGSARQLQGWFTSRIAEHLADRGRLLVGWDEILESGAPPGSVVMSWRSADGGARAASAGHDVVMAPQQWLYFDWAYEDDVAEPLAICPATSVERVFGFDPVPASIPAGERRRVLGAQCQLWTEFVPNGQHAEYMYFPRVSAFAEVVWRGPARVEADAAGFDEFAERLARHLRRLDAVGVNYRPLDGPTPGQSWAWSQE